MTCNYDIVTSIPEVRLREYEFRNVWNWWQTRPLGEEFVLFLVCNRVIEVSVWWKFLSLIFVAGKLVEWIRLILLCFPSNVPVDYFGAELLSMWLYKASTSSLDINPLFFSNSSFLALYQFFFERVIHAHLQQLGEYLSLSSDHYPARS